MRAMRTVAALLCCIAQSLAARADVTPREDALLDPALLPPPDDAPPRLDFTLWAQSLGEAATSAGTVDRGAALAAGGELRVNGSACRILTLGADLRYAFASDGNGLGGSGWLSVCAMAPWGDLPLPSLALSFRFDGNAHPSFDSEPLLQSRPYSEMATLIDVRFLDFARARDRFQFVDAHFQLAFDWQDAQLAFAATMGTDLFRWARKDGLELDAMRIRMTFLSPADDSFAAADSFSLIPLRASGIPIGPLRLDAEAGFGTAEVYAARAGASDPPVWQRSSLVGALGLRGGRGRVGFGLGYRRGVDVSRDGDVILDDRVTGWARVRLGAAELRLASFAARSDLDLPSGGEVVGWTGGGEARLGVPIGKHLRFGVTSEAARTFYGRLAGDDPRPRPQSAVRVLGVLTASLGRAR